MRKKLRVLNNYPGIGGNRKLWENVEVTAVEINEKIARVYQDFFPNDKVIIGDAHQYLLDHFEEFDIICGGPPCQSHSRMMKFTRHKVVKYPDFKLYEEIVFLDNFFKGKWVIENVKPYYEPLIKPSCVMGRHLFWSNFEITPFEIPSPPNFINNNTVAGSEELKKWLGLQYEGNIYYDGNHSPSQVLRNCVHPKLGNHILNCARNIITKQNVNQGDMFLDNESSK